MKLSSAPPILKHGVGGGSLGTPNLYYVIYGRPLLAIYLNHRHLGGNSQIRYESVSLRDLFGAPSIGQWISLKSISDHLDL